MSSSESTYELFEPFTSNTFDSSEPDYLIYHGRLSIIFNFTAPKKATISFRGITGGGFMRHALWKIVASATITREIEKRSLTTNLHCSNFAATHTFDATEIEPLGQVEVKINFKELVGFGVVPRPWDYYRSSSLTDICLVVDGERYYQNKAVLAYHSPYFRTLFFVEFAEKEKDKIKIEYVCIGHFCDLMDAMHGVLSLDDTNFKSLLEDADHFDIPIVVRRVEEFLLHYDRDQISDCEKLFLSDKYQMPQLQAHVLCDWTKDDSLEVWSDPMFKELSKDTLLAIFAVTNDFQ